MLQHARPSQILLGKCKSVSDSKVRWSGDILGNLLAITDASAGNVAAETAAEQRTLHMLTLGSAVLLAAAVIFATWGALWQMQN